jgi:TolB-like protein/Flp pilus assembly protein TadD
MSSLFNELKRRNVVRVSIAYIVVAWLLIQLAGALEPALLLPDWVDRVVTVFLMIGFPVVLIFAWAFELTPDGIKRTSEVNPEESITPKTGKKLEYTIIASLGLVVVFFLAKEFMPSPDADDEIVATSTAPASIAVLPFEDFSADKDQDFFSKGISEEILNLLAKTNALRVAARTSSFAFAGSEMDIRDIGNKLDVDTVLEGSIRTAGSNIRITAQLINVDDGYHLWSETYDRNYSDIFKIQDEIAAHILDALKVHLLGEELAPARQDGERTVNLDAYNAYLIGKERLALRTRNDILAGKAKFVEALSIDPDYAPAHVGAAHAGLLLESFVYGGEGRESDEADAEISEHLQRALALAPELPEGFGVRGYHHLQRFRYEEAEVDLNRAISLNPSYALAYTWRSDTAREQTRYLDMLADLEKAYALDPMSLEISERLAFAYRSFWRPKDAERVIARMFDLHPEHPLAYDAALNNLHAHGRLGEAILLAEKGLLANPDDENLSTWKGWLLLQVGLFDEAIAAGDEFVDFNALMLQGRFDQARAILDEGLAGENASYWDFEARVYAREAGDGPTSPEFREHLDASLVEFEKNNVQWRERCITALIGDMRDAGRGDETAGMMARCEQVYEDRIKAGYLCPCSFYGVLQYTILDGRIDEAVERANQWLSNGDSMAYLPTDPIFQLLSDRPEYQEFINRNEAQLARQRQIYLSGRNENSVAKNQNEPRSGD